MSEKNVVKLSLSEILETVRVVMGTDARVGLEFDPTVRFFARRGAVVIHAKTLKELQAKLNALR